MVGALPGGVTGTSGPGNSGPVGRCLFFKTIFSIWNHLFYCSFRLSDYKTVFVFMIHDDVFVFMIHDEKLEKMSRKLILIAQKKRPDALKAAQKPQHSTKYSF